MPLQKMKKIFLVVLFSLASCAPATEVTTPQLVNAYATSAAHPWLDGLYNCAPQSVPINLSDPASADISIRLGEPDHLTTPAFQIGNEDVLIVVHPQAGVGSLTADQVRAIFLGQVTNWKEVGGNDMPVLVWTYAQDEDVQQIFERTIMSGQPVTSLARLAVSAQNMSDSVGNTPGSIGILPRRWKTGNTREALTVASVPVLAITRSEPTGAVNALIGCLQK